MRLFEALPELADLIPPETRQIVSEAYAARALRLQPGSWTPPPPDRGLLGYVITSGFILRRTALGCGRAAELLGPADLLRPHDSPLADGLLPVRAGRQVLTPTRLAVLESGFQSVVGLYPQLAEGLVARAISRTRSAAALAAIGHMNRIHDRVVALFCHLASLHGKVSADGIVLSIPLSHEQIADLIGCERPSVTTALGRLRELGLVTRRYDRAWLLAQDLARAAAPPRAAVSRRSQPKPPA
ncbi:MAG: Crp/Fnr family transcriptional regulator [Thermoleophilaceae bacterium]